MPQTRFWNFKADDRTQDINRWLTGIIAPGLYFGFDFAPSANMNLTLNHNTTGFKDVAQDGTESAFQALSVMRNGIVVKENAALTINGIAVGDATNPRIDIVVLSCSMPQTAGGATALYSVIQGTPAPSPVAPALADPNAQIKIGQLFIPAGITALNQGGVTWTRNSKPGFAGTVFTVNRAMITDGGGNPAVSVTTVTELSYVNGVTSAIQTQIDSKQATITGGATTILTSNLGANRALVSSGTGKVIVSSVVDSELNRLIGVTSPIQTQIDSKQDIITGAATTIVSSNLTIQRALMSNASGKVAVSAVSQTSLETLTGVNFGRAVTSLESASLTGYKLRFKTVEIGDWDMDSTGSLGVPHGLGSNWVNIRFIDCIIRNDANTTREKLNRSNSLGSGQLPQGFISDASSTDIGLTREGSGRYDAPAYSATSYNRGWVIIGYEIVN